jgi:hypothetical protein
VHVTGTTIHYDIAMPMIQQTSREKRSEHKNGLMGKISVCPGGSCKFIDLFARHHVDHGRGISNNGGG